MMDKKVAFVPLTVSGQIPASTAMRGRLVPGSAHRQQDYEASKIAVCGVRHADVFMSFQHDVDQKLAEDPRNFIVRVNGSMQVLNAGDLSYDPARRVLTLRHIEFHRGDEISVTVIGLWGGIKHIPAQSAACQIRVPGGSVRQKIWWALFGGSVVVGLLALIVIGWWFLARDTSSGLGY